MGAGFKLFQLKLKKYGKAVPVILLESLLFGLLIAAFGLFATKYVYSGRVIGEIRVGIVSMEDQKLSRMLVNFVSSMDSMEDNCSFELMEEDEALKELENGGVYAVIILPDGLIDGIMNGQNIPATILFSRAYSRMETEVFKELAETGSRLLTTAQAGIYAADELCLELKHQEWIQKTEEYLNEAYLQYALGRASVFKLREVNAAGEYSLVQYYAASFLLVFLSFAGLTLGRFAEGIGTPFSKIIAARGCNRCLQFLAETMAFAIIFSLFGTAAGILYFLLTGQWTGFAVPGIVGMVKLFLVFFSMGLLVRLLVWITGNGAAGLGISFLVLLVMMTASGLFLPQAFLPRFLEFGKYLPYKLWLNAVLKMMC